MEVRLFTLFSRLVAQTENWTKTKDFYFFTLRHMNLFKQQHKVKIWKINQNRVSGSLDGLTTYVHDQGEDIQPTILEVVINN